MLLSWFKLPPESPTPHAATPPRCPVRRVEQLPTLSATASRAIDLANNPNTGLGEYSNLIRGDGALSTAVLKLANSSWFCIGPPVYNLNQAVLRLGLRTCSQVVTSLTMRDLFRDTNRRAQRRCEVLWRHGFFTACLCGQLNRFLGAGFCGEEFAAGLLHDLGRTILTLMWQDTAAEVDPLDFDDGPQRLARERKAFGNDHTAIGAEFCKENRLPPAVLVCNQFHHDPQAAPQEYRLLVAVVALADQIADAVQRTHRIRGYPVEANSGYVAVSKCGNGRLSGLAHQLPRMVVDAMKETRSLLKCTSR